MAEARIVTNYEGIGAVMRLPQVRRALRAQADRVAARARSIDASEGGNARITVVEGTRPKGRAFARVVSDDVDGEFGSSKTARRRTLGRAADIGG
jgi:hypothetical protein